MSWSDFVSAGIFAFALVQLSVTLRVWVGVSSRHLAFELAVSGFVGGGELAALVSRPAPPPHLTDGLDQLVGHCAAAALLAIVVVHRAVHFRRHQRQLEADIELIDRAIALKAERAALDR